MRFHKKKKAFSTAEMLVCCVAIGLLIGAIGVFTTSISNYILELKRKESEMLDEYADVQLISQNAISEDAVSNILSSDVLAFEHHLVEVSPIASGSNMTMVSHLRNSGVYVVKWTIENDTIASITEDGVLTAIQPGNTYVTAIEYEVGESGAISETGKIESFPITVSAADVYGDSSDLKCFAYIGKHYQIWKYIDIGA